MSRRLQAFFAFALAVSALLFLPTAARAESDPPPDGPPIVRAWIEGNLLRMEAEGYDVDAVFVDGKRVAYRVNGAFAVILDDYAGTGAYLSVYVVDIVGRASNVVQLPNPGYVSPTPTPAATTKPTQSPATPTTSPSPEPTPEEASLISTASETEKPKPFTPDGTGETVDNATEEDGKEFFTVVTEDDNTFYLVVDRQRDNQNVYFLNTVTEADLAALAEKDKPEPSATPAPAPTPRPFLPTPTPEPALEPPEPDGLNAGAILLVVVAVLGVGGAAYYLKIVRPRQQAQSSDEDDGESEAAGEDGTDRPYDNYDDLEE